MWLLDTVGIHQSTSRNQHEAETSTVRHTIQPKLLPAYHSITGLDRTSYLFGDGKVKPFKKALKNDKIVLLQCFQNEEDKEMKSSKKFVQTIMYPGKDNESVAETRS